MRQSRKTVYQMCRAMNMPGSFWLMHQLKDFGCHLGERSKSCSVGVANGMAIEQATKNVLSLSKATRSWNSSELHMKIPCMTSFERIRDMKRM